MEIPFLDPLIGLRFEVKIDGDNIGTFTTCEGLGASIDMQEYHEGGENGFSYKIPGRLMFTPIVLTRALDPAVGSLAPWFTAFQNVPGGGKTGAITVYSGMLLQVAQWNLVDVYPSRWTGPHFGVAGAGVAQETLELVHHGFLPSSSLFPSVAKSALVKASLMPKDTGEALGVRFMFNPTEYTITAQSSWKQTPAKGKDGPKSEFTGTLPQTLAMDVLFVQDWGGANKEIHDVIADTYTLRELTKPSDQSISKGKPSPPVLLFQWGDSPQFYDCHLKSVTIKYTMFDAQGNPTRATASVVLERVLAETPKQNPTSGGPIGNRAHVVSAGDSLASIAYREYDDAALWRGLADLNGIDDPMALRTGQRLIVPPFEQVAARS